MIVSSLSYGQDNTQKLIDLKVLGRDSLINMAIDQIVNDESFSDFNRGNFDSIKVYIEDDDIYVVFSMAVLFSPMNSDIVAALMPG